MLKKDPIFWWATAIFILAIVLFALTQNQLWLALMIASYLLRPTLASLGVAKHYVDERQLSIHYRSGNIAFAVMILVCVIFAVKLDAENNHDWEIFNLIIALGLAAKALMNVILAKNWRAGATKIIITVGLLITLFVVMESMHASLSLGTFMHLLPGLAIIGVGLLSKYFPKVIGAVILVITIALVFMILSKGFTWGQIGTAVIIGVPLLIASACLFSEDKSSANMEQEKAA